MAWEHMETVARRKANGGPGWQICRAESIGDANLIEGGVPRLLKSGPNKGKPTWQDCKHFDKVIVTHAEAKAEESAYEAASGNCHQCTGKAEVFASWNVNTGSKYRPCPRCNGTGKAPASQEARP